MRYTDTVSIVYKGRAVITGLISGASRSDCEDRAFEFADRYLDLTEDSDKSEVELYFHSEPRHRALFADVLIEGVES